MNSKYVVIIVEYADLNLFDKLNRLQISDEKGETFPKIEQCDHDTRYGRMNVLFQSS